MNDASTGFCGDILAVALVMCFHFPLSSLEKVNITFDLIFPSVVLSIILWSSRINFFLTTFLFEILRGSNKRISQKYGWEWKLLFDLLITSKGLNTLLPYLIPWSCNLYILEKVA